MMATLTAHDKECLATLTVGEWFSPDFSEGGNCPFPAMTRRKHYRAWRLSEKGILEADYTVHSGGFYFWRFRLKPEWAEYGKPD